MFGDGSLTLREFAMKEPLPLATIHEAVLEFLRNREDAVLFGAQFVPLNWLRNSGPIWRRGFRSPCAFERWQTGRAIAFIKYASREIATWQMFVKPKHFH
jgi:hypothetical protein